MNAADSIATGRSPFFSHEHEMLRQTVRRFVAGRVLPHADRWEEDGCVPREVLREMGALGLLGIRFERMSRDGRIQSIGGGATEVMLEEIAKRL